MLGVPAVEGLAPDAGPGRAVAGPALIPDHTLLRPIGRGAYGEVWLARNVMGALRAVKLIWRRQFESQRPYDREFAGIQRFEPVSRSSSGLVHVLHVGRNDAEGYFYYVMELADAAEKGISESVVGESVSAKAGASLPPSAAMTDSQIADYSPRTLRSDLNRLGRLPTADCVGLGLEVVGGLAQLHRHGLVHRDVKPGNIIYVHGRAKLADIGLVSAGGEGRTFVGTEGYIPPEGPGTAAADLYALGIALYEASTGHPPERFPDMPAEWMSDAAGNEALEFHEIILKACEGQHERRYESAEAMQSDLALLQSGRSLRRMRALEQRYARLRLSGIIGTSLLVCALVALFFANYRARLAAESRAKEAGLREQAQASLARAEDAERESRRQLYKALLEQAQATVRSGELGQRVNALDAVRRAAAISNSAALRGVALAAHALPDLRLERELPYGSEFTLRQVDPSFERIALCRRSESVEIRSLADQRLLVTLPASANLPTHYAEWSPDGRFLAVKRDYDSGGTHSDKEVWDVTAARQRLLLRDAPYNAMSFHPRFPRLLVARTGGVAVWDLEQRAEVGRIPLNGTPRWLRFAPDGERFAANYPVDRAWMVSVHRMTGELLASNVFDKFVASFNWHPSGGWISVADHGGGVHRMDARTGETRLIGRHKAEATRTEFTPDGAYLMSGGWERELICWDACTLQRAFAIWLNGYVGRFRSDGRAYALETEASVQLHAFESADGHRELTGDLGPRLIQAAFSPDSRWLAAAGTERLGVWDLHSHGPGTLATNAWGTRVCFAANGELLADRPGAGFRWRVSPARNPESPPELVPLELALPERFSSLCVVSNGIVMSGASGSAVIGTGELGNAPREWTRTVAGFNGVSPDGRWLALFASFTPQLFVYRLPDLERVAVLTNAFNVRTFQFSPSSDELAVSSRSDVEFWSTATWQRTRTISNFNNQLYSADGRAMWLTQEFHAGGLHDAGTLDLLMPLPVGTYPLAVSPDGRRLAVSVDLRRLQVWDLAEVRAQLARLGLDWRE
jgi:WD40 repeat protein